MTDYPDPVVTAADSIEEQEYDDYDSIVEEIFHSADEWAASASVDDCHSYLLDSPNGPGEWQHYVGDGDYYQDVLAAMAFNAFDNDLYHCLAERDVV